jgi:RNA recognition motif-containing protein
MSIDSKESVEEKAQDLIEDVESESMEIEEEESQDETNNNFPKNSRITKANKDLEALENIDKVNLFLNWFKKLFNFILFYLIFKNNTGAIYIGHLPWGFDEKGVKKYFAQFGNITRIMLPRSQKVINYK